MKVKCFHCKKEFKKDNDIYVTDGRINEAVHAECQYEHLLTHHLNTYVTLDELKNDLKEQ